jgi:hypothetical protein
MYGGAISTTNVHATYLKSEFESNSAAYGGGAVFGEITPAYTKKGSIVTTTGCKFLSNSIDNTLMGGSGGAAIRVHLDGTGGQQPMKVSCQATNFTANTVNAPDGSGAALLVKALSSAVGPLTVSIPSATFQGELWRLSARLPAASCQQRLSLVIISHPQQESFCPFSPQQLINHSTTQTNYPPSQRPQRGRSLWFCRRPPVTGHGGAAANQTAGRVRLGSEYLQQLLWRRAAVSLRYSRQLVGLNNNVCVSHQKRVINRLCVSPNGSQRISAAAPDSTPHHSAAQQRPGSRQVAVGCEVCRPGRRDPLPPPARRPQLVQCRGVRAGGAALHLAGEEARAVEEGDEL